MIFWIAVAILAAVVTFVVTRPLVSAGSAYEGRDADVAVYRDQLREIDADVGRGALTDAEAEAARVEVSRRLLRVAEGDLPQTSDHHEPRRAGFASPRVLHAALSVLLPVTSLAVYLGFGEPGMPGLPLEARLKAPVTNANAEELVARVEAALRKNPADGRGWQVIAPVYRAQGRYGDAAGAYAKAMTYLGESPQRLRGFAEARIRQENGIIPDDARKAFERLLASQPNDFEAKFWLAAAQEQNGELKAAAAAYEELLATAPPNAAWRGMVEARMRMARGEPPTADVKVPKGAAAEETPAQPSPLESGTKDQEDQAAMIRNMVAGLAARLRDDPNDLKGWMMLIRSYHVLGAVSDARQALTSARQALASDAAAIAELNALAESLQIKG